MEMLLFNRSTYPTPIIRYLLLAAAECVGAKPNILVLVGQRRKRTYGYRAVCYRADTVIFSGYWLGYRAKTVECKTNSAYLRFTLPNPHTKEKDPLKIAEDIFKLFLHEFHHVKERQQGLMEKLGKARRRNGRRPAWHRRPEEIRAENAVKHAVANGVLKKYADGILGLAKWLEGRQGEC